jgi:GH25 family lysozyme M1 (1,4-beta-N-acetylmuramidase)
MFRRVAFIAVAAATVILIATPSVLDAQGVQGGDVATLTPQSAFACAISTGGWEFIIIRGFDGTNVTAVDPTAAANLRNAHLAGFKYTDVYHVPCAFAIDPVIQVWTTVDALHSLNFGTLWITVEPNPDPACGWSTQPVANCNFLSAMINAAAAAGQATGIYTSRADWGAIMGGCEVGAANTLPLWYANFDYKPSFDDYKPFGGWAAPSIKQYWDSVGINCAGLAAAADWYP